MELAINECNGNGIFINGHCECKEGYGGPDCLSRYCPN